jgi:hypothetical protein
VFWLAALRQCKTHSNEISEFLHGEDQSWEEDCETGARYHDVKDAFFRV